MKIIKLVYSLLFCVSSYISLSQSVVINVKPPASPTFASSDIWNFDVINQSGIAFKARFEATISNNKNGVLVQLSSNTVNIPIGISSYWPTNIQTRSVKYLNPLLADLERNTHSLPSGSYLVCISFICVEECEKIHSESGPYCVDDLIEETSPLLLNSPLDLDTIQVTNPILTWIPPMPSGSSPDMSYTISLYKMRDKQSAQDAVSRNRALLKQSSIKDIALLYPSGVDQLEIGSKYAWYAEAWLGNIHVATSEVWQFVIAKEKKKKIPEFITYVKVNDNLTTVHNIKDFLRYSYIEEYNGKQIQISIIDINENKTLYKGNRIVKYGENLFSESVSELGLVNGNFYKLYVTNGSDQTFELMFNVN